MVRREFITAGMLFNVNFGTVYVKNEGKEDLFNTFIFFLFYEF